MTINSKDEIHKQNKLKAKKLAERLSAKYNLEIRNYIGRCWYEGDGYISTEYYPWGDIKVIAGFDEGPTIMLCVQLKGSDGWPEVEEKACKALDLLVEL